MEKREMLETTGKLVGMLALAAALAARTPAKASESGSATSPAKAGAAGDMVQLGGPATGAGTLNADLGEVTPLDPAKFHKESGYSPYAGRRYPTRPYFGDEHVHTG